MSKNCAPLSLTSIVVICLFGCTESLESTSGSDAEATVEATASLDSAIERGRYRQITSVVASRDSQIQLERYYGEGSAEHLNNTRSATKSLTAMAVGAAIADGHIGSVTDPASRYIDGLAAADSKDPILIADLLSMTSALSCNDDDMESPGNEEHMHTFDFWLGFVRRIPRDSAYQRDENGIGRFSYCTAGTFLLGQIIGATTEQSADQYINDRILAPLGISQVEWYYSPSRETQTGGGTLVRARDLLKLAELARNQGTYDGQSVIPSDWVSAMLTQYATPYPDTSYGYLWWHNDFRCASDADPNATVSGWYMSGNGGNKVVVFDELAMSVVVTATLYGTRGMHQQSTDIIERFVLPEIGDCEPLPEDL